MRESYLGLANNNGLRLLVPEHDHAALFLMRRACRENGVCLWTVIDTKDYDYVRGALSLGEYRHAFRLLEQTAIDIGVLTETHWMTAYTTANR